MADWSQLPTELLQLISNHLNNDLFYLLRLRSVCSTWRSSIPIPNPNHHHHHQKLPSKVPLFSNDSNFNDKSKTFSLSKRTLFLISPPPKNPTIPPCIIKINNSNNQLLHPLSYYLRLPLCMHRLFDFNDLSVVELDHEFVLRNDAKLSLLSPPSPDYLGLFRVVVFEIERCDFLLTVHNSGKLAVFRCGDDRWTIVPDPEMRTYYYDGVCVFKGKPIAVDCTGRTVRVRVGVGIEPELGLDLVAYPILGGDQKYLVESNGELLLVDKDSSRVFDGVNFRVRWIVKFNVYRLDENEKRWVKLTSLGDRTLFLADDCAFSVSASDLGSRYRNCVIFRDDINGICEYDTALFDLDLEKQEDYQDLFWPPKWVRMRPPKWVRLLRLRFSRGHRKVDRASGVRETTTFTRQRTRKRKEATSVSGAAAKRSKGLASSSSSRMGKSESG